MGKTEEVKKRKRMVGRSAEGQFEKGRVKNLEIRTLSLALRAHVILTRIGSVEMYMKMIVV